MNDFSQNRQQEQEQQQWIFDDKMNSSNENFQVLSMEEADHYIRCKRIRYTMDPLPHNKPIVIPAPPSTKRIQKEHDESQSDTCGTQSFYTIARLDPSAEEITERPVPSSSSNLRQSLTSAKDSPFQTFRSEHRSLVLAIFKIGLNTSTPKLLQNTISPCMREKYPEIKNLDRVKSRLQYYRKHMESSIDDIAKVYDTTLNTLFRALRYQLLMTQNSTTMATPQKISNSDEASHWTTMNPIDLMNQLPDISATFTSAENAAYCTFCMLPCHNLLLPPKHQHDNKTTWDKTTPNNNGNEIHPFKGITDHKTDSVEYVSLELPILSPGEKKSCIGIVWTSFIHSFATYVKEIHRQRLSVQRVNEYKNMPISVISVKENEIETDETSSISTKDHPLIFINSSQCHSFKDLQDSKKFLPTLRNDVNPYNMNRSHTLTTTDGRPGLHERNLTIGAPSVLSDKIMKSVISDQTIKNESINHPQDLYEPQILNKLMNYSKMPSTDIRRSNNIVQSSIENPMNIGRKYWHYVQNWMDGRVESESQIPLDPKHTLMNQNNTFTYSRHDTGSTMNDLSLNRYPVKDEREEWTSSNNMSTSIRYNNHVPIIGDGRIKDERMNQQYLPLNHQNILNVLKSSTDPENRISSSRRDVRSDDSLVRLGDLALLMNQAQSYENLKNTPSTQIYTHPTNTPGPYISMSTKEVQTQQEEFLRTNPISDTRLSAAHSQYYMPVQDTNLTIALPTYDDMLRKFYNI